MIIGRRRSLLRSAAILGALVAAAAALLTGVIWAAGAAMAAATSVADGPTRIASTSSGPGLQFTVLISGAALAGLLLLAAAAATRGQGSFRQHRS